MNIIRLSPVFLSALLFAAHWMYHGLAPLAVVSIVFPLILLFQKSWAARIIQIFLVIATLEWLRTIYVLAQQHIADGTNWTRMAIILTIVAAITLASACVFFTKPLKARYKLNRKEL